MFSILITALYTAVILFFFAQRRKDSGWGCLGWGGLVFGINKQLDLQTFVLEAGRDVCKQLGIYSERLILHRVLFLVFILVLGGCIVWFVQHHRRFISANRFVCTMSLCLVLVYFGRAASIDHLVTGNFGRRMDLVMHAFEAMVLAGILVNLTLKRFTQRNSEE